MKTRIKPLFMMMFIFLVGIEATLGEQGRRAPFSFVISAPKTEVKSGSAVAVHATVTNTSDVPIALDGTGCVAVVRGADGNLSPETDLGRKLKGKQRERISPGFGGSRVGEALEPGKSISEECIVSDLYDMTHPGQYSIQLERTWHRGVVPSNTIKVKVIH